MTVSHFTHRIVCWIVGLGAACWWGTTLLAQSPQWIWPQESRHPDTVAVWSKTVTCPAGVQQAWLSGVADFCRLSVRWNGQEIATTESFGSPFFRDVTRAIQAGDNLLEVRATSDPGPAAIALRLQWTAIDGSQQVVVTDKSWSSSLTIESTRSSHAESAELGEVREFELDPRRPFEVSALDDYAQWKQALGTAPSTVPASFQVAHGFQLELIRSAGSDEGSWISMAIDSKGRFIIGREDRGLLRMTLAEDGRSISKVETLNDSLLECRGLLFAHDCLYVNANNSKGCYRLRDTDGDDQFDEVRLLREFSGGVGHGRNDLALGPDGKIYLIHGDSVALPEDSTDLTSPFREHRRGQPSQEGHLLRTDADGQSWQLVAAGLRNPYGIAFHADGEIFTYDADAEFDMGAPWYRPTQVKHLVPGSDFGWRGVTGKWPPYFPDHPDNAVPSVHIGKGSPTSIQFGYRSNFPPPYRDALFILDWAYGRIIAVHLTARGGSYSGRPEHFLKGRPLNVTDLDFGPDGAMYFVTGGRKTQAGLYRVRYEGAPVPYPAATVQQMTRQRHSATTRSHRRELESLLISTREPPALLDSAWPHLDSTDPSIRYAARMVVERQPIAFWRDRALQEERLTAGLTALLALARGEEPSSRTPIVRRLNEFSMPSLTVAQQLMALHVYRLCLADQALLDSSVLRDATTRLAAIFPHASPEVNEPLCLVLAPLDTQDMVSKTIPLLLASTDQADQLRFLFALRSVRSGWTPSLRDDYIAGLRRSTQYLGGEGMPGFLSQIRGDFLAAIPDSERESYASLSDLKTMAAGDPLPQRPLVRRWTMAELEDVASATGEHRDVTRGRQLYSAALCARCHRLGIVGQPAGPDLTGLGRRFSRRDILQSILDPSRVVAEQYHSDRVVTTDGRVLIGRIIQSGDFRSTTMRLVADPLQPQEYTEITKRDIESHSTIPTSPMPAGLLDTLTKDEIADLLAFLESGGAQP